MHALLARQLRKLGIDANAPTALDATPTNPTVWSRLLDRVSRTYVENDQDRYVLERSLAISSQEMHELYDDLQRASETRVAAERDRLRAVFLALGAGLCILDAGLRIQDANPTAAQLLAAPVDRLKGLQLGDLLDPAATAGREAVYEAGELAARLHRGDTVSALDVQFCRRDGGLLPVGYVLTPIKGAGGLEGAVLVFRDRTESKGYEQALRQAHDKLAQANEVLRLEIGERQRAEEALRQSEQRFRSLVQNSSDIIAVMNAEGIIQYVTPSVASILGHRPAQVEGTPAVRWVHPNDLRLLRANSLGLGERASSWRTQIRLRGAGRVWRYADVVVTNLLDVPSVGGIVVNARDVTERRQLESRLQRQAYFDPLTGLPNRTMFMERLAQWLTSSDQAHAGFSLLFLDLDGFKVVNDSLGHAAGDTLLAEIAGRLRSVLRQNDLAARFGGDEFTMLVDGVDGRDAALAVADRVLAALRTPVRIDGRDVFVTASIGVALHTAGQVRADAGELVREADIALYQAKAAGKSRAAMFDPSMHVRAVARLDLETDLRHALQRRELEVYYQPEVDPRTLAIVGAEALVRWNHPQRGLITPDEFIPLAEETGLILEIGHWVLFDACRQGALWRAARPEAPFMLSVNLSPRQFATSDLVGEVREVLRRTGFPADCLRLEITESVLMEDGDSTLRTLLGLRALGLHLAIDDFGTGYSSLSYLQRFPVETVKIDRSFVTAVDRSSGARAILQTVTALAHVLGMEVTAEGIETAEHLAFVCDAGCDRGQGYLFAHPLPVAEMAQMLSDADAAGADDPSLRTVA